MTTTVNFEFSQQDLDGRIFVKHVDYENSLQTLTNLGAIERFSPDTVAEGLELYAEKRKAGYTPSTITPACYIGNPLGGVPSYLEFFIVKPAKQQAKDKAAIAAKVEAEYRAELEQLFNQHVEQEAARTVEHRRRQLEAERIAREEAELEAARAEIIALYKGVA